MLNFFRTGLLLAALTALFMAVGYFIGGTNGMLIAFGIAVVTNILGYWNADKLVLSVNNPEGGSATEEIGVEYDAPPLEIGFNARYLLDIAGQLESETAHFQLADPGSPTMVKDGSDEGALYVLMPMRV